MKAIKFVPGKRPEVVEIDNTLEALQEAVGGYIETVSVFSNGCLICNEEGILLGLEPQEILGHAFFGTCLFVGVKGDEFTDIPVGARSLFKVG